MKIATIKLAVIVVILGLALLAQITPHSKTSAQAPPPPTIVITPTMPTPDIPQPINLQNAAVFAWQEFIALNWPAVTPQNGQLNTRDMPDKTQVFGSPAYTNQTKPLVWHTFRAKVEIFPGQKQNSVTPVAPNGYVNDAALAYGYDALPQYLYSPDQFPNGQVPPATTPGPVTPWINLDENSEIGLNMMYAGIAPTNIANQPGQQILFMAKANRQEYTYVAANKWWSQNRFDPNNPFNPIQNTANYIQQNGQSLPPGATQLPPNPNNPTPMPAVSFPDGTIEVKAAWRQLTADEFNSGRFYSTYVRHYATKAGTSAIVYEDNYYGLVALHIIQKTASSPYFVYATFSQADNLLDVHGQPVEDVNGKYVGDPTVTPLDPDITSRNATPASPTNPGAFQSLSPLQSPRVSGTRLYYQNVPSAPSTPQGVININKRKHAISDTIVQVNQVAHTAIDAYNKQNELTSSPWLYYKLVSVQYQPYDKPAGITYTGAPGGPDPSTYYQANEVVESDYNLQVFSGQFQNVPPLNPPLYNNLITDYNADGSVFKNVYYNGSGYLMGGCMGCHGNAQVAGADFSFIFLGGPVPQPDTAGTFADGAIAARGLAKFRKLLLRK